jgi:hypothetical protein
MEIRAATTQKVSGQLSVDAHQEILNRADEIESRLKSVKAIREKHQELSEAEVQELLATTKAPFDLKDMVSLQEVQKLLAGSALDLSVATSMKDRGFSWKKTITKDGEINFFLVVPTQKFRVWTKEEYANLRRRAGRRNNPTNSASQEVAPG